MNNIKTFGLQIKEYSMEQKCNNRTEESERARSLITLSKIKTTMQYAYYLKYVNQFITFYPSGPRSISINLAQSDAEQFLRIKRKGSG